MTSPWSVDQDWHSVLLIVSFNLCQGILWEYPLGITMWTVVFPMGNLRFKVNAIGNDTNTLQRSIPSGINAAVVYHTYCCVCGRFIFARWNKTHQWKSTRAMTWHVPQWEQGELYCKDIQCDENSVVTLNTPDNLNTTTGGVPLGGVGMVCERPIWWTWDSEYVLSKVQPDVWSTVVSSNLP